VLLHRFASLGTPAAMNLLAVSILGLFVAIAIAIAALVRIWFGGQTGAGEAVAAILVAVVGLAVPLFYLAHAATLPPLTDVETTQGEVLDFKILNTMRPADANPITAPDSVAIDQRDEAYPDLASMALERSTPEVFNLVREAVERLGWQIVLNEPPGETGIGLIEATDRTLIMGFTDDVVVRVKGDEAHALIDARSISRYGLHDLGTNAERIRALFTEITAALEKGEKTVLEQAEPKEEATENKAPADTKRAKKSVRKKR
jgi:uncharacterized protein (DUF1499 family)